MADAVGIVTPRVLSLARPWDELVLDHGKDRENRPWTTPYRGLLLIHASRTFDPGAAYVSKRILGEIPASIRTRGVGGGGHLVGAVDLVDICRSTLRGGFSRCECGPWAMPGLAHWHVTNPRRLARPIPLPGRLGLWRVPLEVADDVTAQLGATP